MDFWFQVIFLYKSTTYVYVSCIILCSFYFEMFSPCVLCDWLPHLCFTCVLLSVLLWFAVPVCPIISTIPSLCIQVRVLHRLN